MFHYLFQIIKLYFFPIKKSLYWPRVETNGFTKIKLIFIARSCKQLEILTLCLTPVNSILYPLLHNCTQRVHTIMQKNCHIKQILNSDKDYHTIFGFKIIPIALEVNILRENDFIWWFMMPGDMDILCKILNILELCRENFVLHTFTIYSKATGGVK